MKTIRRTVPGFLLACVFLAGNLGATQVPLLDRSQQTIRLMNWWSPVREALTEKQVDLMVESGLNVLLFMGYTPKNCKRALGAASKHPGIEALVWDERIFAVNDTDPKSFSNVDDVVRDYLSYPAFKGFVVRDEPPTKEYARLGWFFDYTRERWPGIVAYVNLLPNYANIADAGAENYADYIRRYVALRPPMVSYDHYLFTTGGDGDMWFANLEEVRAQCLAAGIPPWVIIQFSAWPGIRAVNEGELRWCAYSALAYGYKSICYFCYATADKDMTQCAIELDGSVNKERFALLKKVNRDISTVGHVLMSLTSRRVYHTAPLPKDTHGIPADGWIRSFSGGEWMVGEMRGQHGSYIMIVNRKHDKAQKASVKWSPDVTAVYRVSRHGLALDPVALTKGSTAISLAPGDGELFMITVKDSAAAPKSKMKITGESPVLAGTEPGKLMFADVVPGSMVVRSAYKPGGSQTIVYEQGRDYVVNYTLGTIARAPASRMPDFSKNVLYGRKSFDHNQFPGFTNNGFFVWVDYQTTSGFPLAVPTDQSAMLAKTRAKLSAGGAFKIIAFGDSISAGGEASTEDLRFQNRYAQELKKRFPKAEITVENGATGGDTTANGLARLEEKVLTRKPDLVLVGFGMNDHNVPGYGVALDAFEGNLNEIVSTIRGRTGAEVILLSTFPPNPDWAFGSHQMEKYAEATKRAAEKQKCAYADVYSVWAKALARKDPSSLLGNNINHPNDFGHWLYLQALEAVRF